MAAVERETAVGWVAAVGRMAAVEEAVAEAVEDLDPLLGTWVELAFHSKNYSYWSSGKVCSPINEVLRLNHLYFH